MRALVYAGPKAVRLDTVRDPVIEHPTDALVRIRLSGICGTDLHVIAGDWPGLEQGSILGHEFVGEIIEIGAAVQTLKRGDRVMSSDFSACGFCRWCTRGEHWHCEERAFFGSGRCFGPPLAGAQAELVRVPHADTTLLALPDSCSAEAALLIGDNLATGWTAVERAKVAPGDSVVIIGGGAIGQLTSLCAQAAGAGIVVVVEPNGERRRFAEAHGALAASPDEARDLLWRATHGDGADVAIEAVGALGPLSSALTLLRRRGRLVSVGAHSATSWEFAVSQAFVDELSLSFAIGNPIGARRRLLAMITAGMLDPTIVIDRRVPLEQAASAYEDLAAQRILKAVIDPAR
jgi:alcohol dehydrogenase